VQRRGHLRRARDNTLTRCDQLCSTKGEHHDYSSCNGSDRHRIALHRKLGRIGDPDVYKVIFEDQNFRVIASTRKKGVHDRVHSHPLPSVVYNVNDCVTRLYAADGKTMDVTGKAGTATTVPIIASHSAENIGPTDCETIFVERK
jgi:hypothetical protein